MACRSSEIRRSDPLPSEYWQCVKCLFFLKVHLTYLVINTAQVFVPSVWFDWKIIWTWTFAKAGLYQKNPDYKKFLSFIHFLQTKTRINFQIRNFSFMFFSILSAITFKLLNELMITCDGSSYFARN
jgi:hypothetical protein